MINEIIDSLRDSILSLPFIDKYGGLVRIVKKAYTNEQGVYYKTFPVTCESDINDSKDEGKLKALMPNSDYKSLAYFESAGSLKVTHMSYKGKDVVKVSAPVDFICWLNLPKFGISECHSSVFHLHIINFFSRKIKKSCSSESFSWVDLSFNINGFASRDEKIFSKYSYGDMMALTVYPFDFFKVNLEIVFYVDPKCVDDYVFRAPIDC